MNTKQPEYGVRRYPMQSKCDLNPFSIFVLSLIILTITTSILLINFFLYFLVCLFGSIVFV